MGLYDNLGDKLLCARAGSYKSCFMNRQIGVGDSKYVLVFDPLFTGHVIGACAVAAYAFSVLIKGTVMTLLTWWQGCARDPPCMTTVKVKRSKVKVTQSRIGNLRNHGL